MSQDISVAIRILLVEDDVLLRTTLAEILEANQYAVDLADDGQVGLDRAIAVEYDLILLDLQIPTLDGMSLCRQLRARGYRKPILLMTANASDAVVVAGFEAGADDYIAKPCASEVLLARMRTLLRRSGAIAVSGSRRNAAAILTWGALTLELEAGRVTIGEQPLSLTATEFNLLELFLRHPDRIFSRSAILDRLWGFEDAPSDRAIVTHVKELRKKLKAGGLTEDLLETVYGMGYRLKPAPTPSSTPADALDSDPMPSRRSGESATIQSVLERFQTVFQQQVAVLERAKTHLLNGTAASDLLQAARQEAHKLSGSLASFGYPDGSKLARSLEHLLVRDRPYSPAEITQVAEWVTALQQELAHPPVVATIAPVPLGQTYRVLVIDDDEALTEQLEAEAEAWGFRMKIAPNPAAARSRLALTPPDVILLDLSFPDATDDGFTLLQEITTRWPHLPVIVFTGRDTLHDRLAVSRLGARQFLHKPATPEQIFRAIVRVSPEPQVSEARVLIVDDDPAMLTALSSLLTPWGLAVTTLTDPQQCWQVLTAIAPALVVLDLELPQISGLELCQVIRQDAQWGDLPILVVTARTDAESLQHAFAAGADDFITKPVLGPELVTRVLSRIERTRLRQQVDNTDNSTRKENEG